MNDTRRRTLEELQVYADNARMAGDRELSDAIAACILRVLRSEDEERDDAA